MRNDLPQRIDPDPVSIALGILGALGSLASIASYVDHFSSTRKRRQAEKRRINQELIEISVEIESAVNELQVHYEKIRMLVEKHAPFLPREEVVSKDPMRRPFEFGGMVLLLPKTDFTKFSSTHQKILQASKSLIKEVYRMARSLHAYGIGISSDTYEQLVKLRTQMNMLLAERIDYAEAMDLYSQLLDFASSVTRQLKQEFLPGHDGTPDAQRKFG